MNPTAPTQLVFIISLVIALIGVLAALNIVTFGFHNSMERFIRSSPTLRSSSRRTLSLIPPGATESEFCR